MAAENEAERGFECNSKILAINKTSLLAKMEEQGLDFTIPMKKTKTLEIKTMSSKH